MEIRNSILYSLFLFFILSCNSNDNEEKKTVNKNLSKKEQLKAKELSPQKKKQYDYNDIEGEELEVLIDSVTQADLDVLHSKFNEAPYFFEIDSQRYYYVVNGKWEQPTDEVFRTGRFSMGITGENYKLILPVEYDKIFSPDVLKKDWIEIQKKGKIGLFNYKTKTLIPCEYDYLFLSMQNYYVAYGYLNNEVFGIKENGESQKLESKISYKDYVGTWSYSVEKNYKPLLIDTYLKVNSEYPEEGKGLSFTPSFFNSLNVFPEVHSGIISNKTEEIGTDTSNSMLTKKKNFSGGITAFFARFYRYGTAGRGDEIEKYQILTLDSHNNYIDSEILLELNSMELPFCKGIKELYFVNDSIFVVKNGDEIDDSYDTYNHMTYYSLFEVKKNGKIQKLESDRFFDFTKFIKIDESYFSGCYLKFLEWKDESTDNVVYFNHLSVNDLDIMRNEIYAEYGYKFKSDKWRNYFRNKPWYSEIYENVDDQLTEIDKANIKVILAVKEKLINDPKIISKSTDYWGFPG